MQTRGTRFLTKSRFKIGYECPAKLYYADRPNVYANKNLDNDFLKALAEGGFQVGAFAKLLYPNGIDLDGTKVSEAVLRTKELLNKDKVTIFEAAIEYKGYRVLIDVLEKNGAQINLYEVKSKSIDSHDLEDNRYFFSAKAGLDSSWEPYIVDVAFQTFVLRGAYPKIKVTPHLMLPDKAKIATVDGLNQLFLIKQNPVTNRTQVITKKNAAAIILGEPILKSVNVSNEVGYVLSEKLFFGRTSVCVVYGATLFPPSKSDQRAKDAQCNV